MSACDQTKQNGPPSAHTKNEKIPRDCRGIRMPILACAGSAVWFYRCSSTAPSGVFLDP